MRISLPTSPVMSAIDEFFDRPVRENNDIYDTPRHDTFARGN